MMTPEQGEITLKESNDRYFLQALPAAIFLIIIVLIGSVGNLLILYVYLTTMKSSAIRCFIVSLALLDLTICLVDIPLEINELRVMFTFGRDVGLCKMFHLIHDFLFITAMYLLVAIAGERFKTVCFPLKNQMSILTARVVIVVCFVLASVLAIPAGFKYGRKTVLINGYDVNGTLCSTADGHNEDLVFFNYVFWILQNICGFTTLITLYFLIWFKVYRHSKTQQNVSVQSSNVQGSSETLDQEIENPPANTHRKSASINTSGSTKPRSKTQQNRSVESSSVQGGIETLDENVKNPPAHPDRKSTPINTSGSPKPAKAVQNLTAVMFTITVTAFIAYIPIMFKMLIGLTSDDALDAFKDAVPWFYFLFFRTYYIPCAANAIIYGLGNPAFRRELKNILRKKTKACSCNSVTQ